MSQIQVELQEFMGSDRSIAEAAWTSSTTLQGKEKRTDEDVARVVKMLIESKHASPIESVVMRFWIKMPIATDRQHMTHRLASHNGMSGRYRTMPNEWLHIPEDVFELMKKYNPDHTMQAYENICQTTNAWYQGLMKDLKNIKMDNNDYKRLREFFRGVLPQHNMTERITVINLRSFANYQKLRNSSHAQLEIQQVAKLMLQEVIEKNICPIAVSTLKDLGWEI